MQAATVEAVSFGDLLRGWRQRQRLSQLELGARCGVSSRHLSFLETGRARPSREMVVRLSDELDIPLRARNVLLESAGFSAVYRERPLDDAHMGGVRKALDIMLTGHDPYPAIVVDNRWNVVQANAGAGIFIDLLPAHLLEPPLNVIRVSFHPEGLPAKMLNFETYAAHLMSRLRRQAERTTDPVLASLLEEATSNLGAMRIDVPPHPVPDVVLPIRLRHPDGTVALFSTISVLGAPLDITLDELAIEAFYPADERSEAILRARVS